MTKRQHRPAPDATASTDAPDTECANEYSREMFDRSADLEDLLTGTARDPAHPGDAQTVTAPAGDRRTIDDLDVGDRIDDFDLLVALGRGAFARVFLARQRSLQRLVAVKISRDHGTEPQTLAQLDHDYIVRVFDQRLVPDLGMKLLYMQYVPGGTLLGVLRRVRETPETRRSGALLLDAIDATLDAKGELRPTDSSVRNEIAALSWPDTVAWIGRRLAEALDHAGRHGILHRDVKPANVLLTAEGVPKLADFNISFSDRLTGTSPVAYFGGSLAYMSPEQLRACDPARPAAAADLDTRSDIYGLGVVLWELLTGHRPFPDVDSAAPDALDRMISAREAGVGPDAGAALPPDCPATLRRILLTCLDPDPDRRWPSGIELARQCRLCLDPHARDLVDPPPSRHRRALQRWAVPILIAAGVIPNALAGAYNYHHNKTLIIDTLAPLAQRHFEQIQFVINAIAFPTGAIVLLFLCRYPLTVPRGLRKGRGYDTATLARARTDTLLLGDRIAVVVFGLWAIAGLAYPIALQVVAGGIPARAYVHFLGSLLVCGAIAVAYPFFFVAFYAVRYLYPVLLPLGITSSDDDRNLRGLDRRSTRYLAVAASVPLVAVAGVTFLDPDQIGQVIGAVRVLSVGAIIAFICAYWLFRQLETDLRALERVVAQEHRREDVS
ncbi:serine/threonine-protein kinase [Rhodococcus sp. NPDC058505]|uniref:serine/threonine-protein kinase n=1 Tax=unclassified Rhodococcus (in: high G+C Gram-positive bacteria) TaxID=192944 RepID=UPI003658E44E